MTNLLASLNVKSTLINRNIVIHGRRTSVRLEPEMWSALFDITARENQNIHEICSLVADKKKTETSLTAAIRVFVMAYFRSASTEDGHRLAGHGSIFTRWTGSNEDSQQRLSA